MRRWCMCLLTIPVLFSSAAWAQEPVKLGFIFLMSGRVAYFGMIAKQGAELAVDEINAAGGINGRKVEALFANTQGNPDVAISTVKKFVTEDKVDAVLGIISSKVAAAVTPVMKDLKVPLIITVAMTPVVTGERCNRYTFRVGWNIDYNTKSAALLAATQDAKRWTSIGPDYRFGYESWKLFKKHLGAMRGDISFAPDSEVVFQPMSTTDWKPHIQKIMNSGSDGILVSLYGGNAIDFVRQGTELGLFDGKREVFLTIASTMEVFMGLGVEMPEGLWVGGGYWCQANPTQNHKDFLEAYKRRYYAPPSWVSEGSYTGVKVYAEAAKKAGSTDTDAIITALEGLTTEGPGGKFTIRADNHQATRDTFWGKTSKKYGLAGRRRVSYRLLDPIRVFTAEEMGFLAQCNCKMKTPASPPPATGR